MSAFVDSFPGFLWTQSWQLACLGIVLLPIIVFLSKKRPHVAILLSYLLIAKALLPPVVGHTNSIFHWLESQSAAAPSAPSPETTSSSPGHTIPTSDHHLTPSQDQARIEVSTTAAIPPRELSPELAIPSNIPPKPIETNQRFSYAVSAIWLSGILISAIHIGRRRQRFRKMVKAASPVRSPQLLDLFDQVKSQLGVTQAVSLCSVEGNISPSVIGWRQPVIVLPSQLIRDAHTDDLNAILAHELLHIKRGDLTISLAQCLSQILWWFHPIVWMANRRINHLREMCCDGEVLHRLDISNTQYAQTLLNVLKQSPRLSLPPYVPAVRSTEITTHRIECLMKTPHYLTHKTPMLGWLAALVLGIFALPSSNVTSAEDQTETKSTPQEIDSELVFAQTTKPTQDSEFASPAPAPPIPRVNSIQRSIEIDTNSNRIFTVDREDLPVTVGYSNGRVVPNTQIHIQATIEGTIKKMNLTPGTRVKKGDILLDMDNETLKRALQQAELNLDTAHAEARQAETLQSQAMLKGRNAQKSAELALELHEREYAQKKALFEKALIAKDQLEAHQSSTERLKQQLSFELESNQLIRESYEQSVELKSLELKRHELARNDIIHQLEQLRIRAPIDGIIAPVEREGDLLVGSRVTAGLPLAQLINPDQVSIKTTYSATAIADIHVGMPTKIRVNGHTIDGHIQTIYPTADVNRNVTVIVALNSPPTEARRIIPGSQALVYYVTEVLPGVLTIQDRLKRLNIPTLLLYKLDKGGDTARAVTIKFGKTGMGRMQISGNVMEGDQLLLDSDAKIRSATNPRKRINLLDQ